MTDDRQPQLPLIPSFLRSYFERAAARELRAKERAYPAMVEAGEISREEAAADIASWQVIAELLRAGTARSSLSWAELELATSRTLLRREEAAKAEPGNMDLIARRDAVWGIHERISWRRHLGKPNPQRSSPTGQGDRRTAVEGLAA